MGGYLTTLISLIVLPSYISLSRRAEVYISPGAKTGKACTAFGILAPRSQSPLAPYGCARLVYASRGDARRFAKVVIFSFSLLE
jgi:hypothetical protein